MTMSPLIHFYFSGYDFTRIKIEGRAALAKLTEKYDSVPPPSPHPFIFHPLCSPPPSPLASTTPSFCITHTLLNNEDEVNPTVTSASQTDFIFTDLLQLRHRPLGIPQTHCVRTLYQAIASAETPLDRHYRTPNSSSGFSKLLQGWGSGPISVHLWRVTAIIL